MKSIYFCVNCGSEKITKTKEDNDYFYMNCLDCCLDYTILKVKGVTC